MSPIELGPRQRGIRLWSYQWQMGIEGAAAALVRRSPVVRQLDLYLFHARPRVTGASEGEFSFGTVLKKLMHQASDTSDSNTSYEVDYVFTTADGRKIEADDMVDSDVWDQLKEGGPVQIEYAASKPRLNQVGATGGAIVGSYIVLIVASAMWLLGATLVVKGLLTRSG
jgi:hypothetical protein